MRVYELAKKAKVSIQQIIEKARELGMEADNNFSDIGEEDSDKLLAVYIKKPKKAAPKKKAAKPLKLKQAKSAPPQTPPPEVAPDKPDGTLLAPKAKAASVEKDAPAPKASTAAPEIAGDAVAGEVLKPKAKKTPRKRTPAKKTKPGAGAKVPAVAEKEKPDGEPEEVAPAVVSEPDTPAEAAKPKPVAAAAEVRSVPPLPQDEETPRSVRKRQRQRSVREEPEYEAPEISVHTKHGPGFIQATPVSRSSRRTIRRKRSVRRFRRGAAPVDSQRKTEFEIETPISIKDLSSQIGVKAGGIIFKLMQLGSMVNINAVLDADQVELLGVELGLKLATYAAATAERVVEGVEQAENQLEDLVPRSPVVTFLGHVDHGKTSLLDRIRRTDVAAHEFGGITQHIGAYRVQTNEKTVVFLDTPGHEAFTAMRARGANVTDIAALVVAADDGVMPQTEEAIDHARAAEVPIVVAINKCDKPEADAMRVKQQLTNLGLQPEEWGGDTVCVEVSAVTGQGVDELMEMLTLVAELRELKANPKRSALGTVIEAEVSGSRGAVATVLVQDGTLRLGDIVLAGKTYGRVKALVDDRGRQLREAGPAWPVTVVGLGDVPAAGDRLVVLRDIQDARAVAEERQRAAREASVLERRHVSLENLFASIEEGSVQELVLILKADVRGTLEALSQVIGGIKSDEVKTRILRSSVGAVSTSDVLLADASDAIIVGMNVGVDGPARALAEEKGVSVRVYNVIYQVKQEIEKALTGMLAPEEREVITGHAEIRRIFKSSRFGAVAGCYITDGAVARNHRARLIRDGAVVYDGRVASLRREKDDAREVREGFECGILLSSYSDLKEGDTIETYRIDEIARTLDGGNGAAK